MCHPRFGSIIHFVHVLQLGHDINVTDKAVALLGQHGASYYPEAYKYDLSEVKSFDDLNIEQQAALVQDFFSC
jgi:hypothetical protein